LLRYEHNVPESVTLAAKAVQYSPTARNYAMLSAAQRANGDLTHALESIEQAIRLAPQSASYRAVRDAIQAAQPSGSKE
jgi:cytochrome c-type biogenesis protein CcmH/NrfG